MDEPPTSAGVCDASRLSGGFTRRYKSTHPDFNADAETDAVQVYDFCLRACAAHGLGWRSRDKADYCDGGAEESDETGREAWTELDVLSKETKPRRSIHQAFKRFPCIGIVDEPDWNDPDTGATEAGKSTPQAPAPGNDKVRASAQHTKRPARDHTPRDQDESKT